jgi:chromosome segregation ATPase
MASEKDKLEALLRKKDEEIAELRRDASMQGIKLTALFEEFSNAQEVMEYKIEHVVRLQQHVENLTELLEKQNKLIVALNSDLQQKSEKQTGETTPTDATSSRDKEIKEIAKSLEALKAFDPCPERNMPGTTGAPLDESAHSFAEEDSVKITKRHSERALRAKQDEAVKEDIVGGSYSSSFDSSVSPSSSSGEQKTFRGGVFGSGGSGDQEHAAS